MHEALWIISMKSADDHLITLPASVVKKGNILSVNGIRLASTEVDAAATTITTTTMISVMSIFSEEEIKRNLISNLCLSTAVVYLYNNFLQVIIIVIVIVSCSHYLLLHPWSIV